MRPSRRSVRLCSLRISSIILSDLGFLLKWLSKLFSLGSFPLIVWVFSFVWFNVFFVLVFFLINFVIVFFFAWSQVVRLLPLLCNSIRWEKWFFNRKVNSLLYNNFIFIFYPLRYRLLVIILLLIMLSSLENI